MAEIGQEEENGEEKREEVYGRRICNVRIGYFRKSKEKWRYFIKKITELNYNGKVVKKRMFV